MSFDRRTPYNDLPPLPPGVDVETKRVLKATISARSALADLNGTARLIPNQSILVRALFLQEARLSSEIENIVTTNDALYQALSRDQWEEHPHIKEVLRYGDALWSGLDLLRSGRLFAASLYSNLATIIKDEVMAVRDLPGTRIANPMTREVVYSPPDGKERILGLLDNLSDFYYAEDEIDPLIKLAIGHYQFEAIHPFRDGNGRTGRLINVLWLVQMNLLDQPILYLSGPILETKHEYYSKLRAVTEEGAWEGWVLYMLQALERTAIDTRARIEQIVTATDWAATEVREKLPKLYSRDLVELVFAQPYTRIQTLVDAGIGQRQTASEYLHSLESIGILRSVKVGQNRLFLNPTLMDILSA